MSASSLNRHFRSKLRRERQRLEASEDEMGEINLVPYLDIVTNILLFLLVTITSMVALGNIEVVVPQYSSGGVVTQEQKAELPFSLTITITNKGFTVAGSEGVMYENDVPGRLPTVPKKGQDYDFKRLQGVLVKIKKLHPNELQAIISANSDTPYDTVVNVMDVVRVDPAEEPLFPSIVFSAGIEY